MKITTGAVRRDKLFKKMLDNGLGGGYYFMDCYNQAVYTEFTPTITTRIDHCHHYFICEVNEI